MELYSQLLEALAHELGNVTSPVGFCAEALALDPSTKRATAVAGTLRSVFGRLVELTAISRLIRDAGTPTSHSFARVSTNLEWTRAHRAFFERVLPPTCEMQVECADGVAPTNLDPLFWPLVTLARFLSDASPVSRRVLLRLSHTRTELPLRMEMTSWGARNEQQPARRWLHYARQTARDANAVVSVRRFPDRIVCRLCPATGRTAADGPEAGN